jgi:hypothetical protein
MVMNNPVLETSAASFNAGRAEIEAAVWAARQRRDHAAGAIIRGAADRCTTTLVSLLAPMFGWQRRKLPATALLQSRQPRSA